MIILKPGYCYQLENFESADNAGQVIQFIEKEPHPDEPIQLVTVRDGTTNEEMLKVLIDRIRFLNNKYPCRENAIVLTKLEESLMWMEKRTKDRKARGVEGKAIS